MMMMVLIQIRMMPYICKNLNCNYCTTSKTSIHAYSFNKHQGVLSYAYIRHVTLFWYLIKIYLRIFLCIEVSATIHISLATLTRKIAICLFSECAYFRYVFIFEVVQ